MIKKLTLFILICFSSNFSYAAHLVGGDLTFQCRGNNQYTFELKVYRDAFATANHDNPAYIYIYNNDNNQIFVTRSAAPQSVSSVANNDLGPCLQNPAPPAFDFATYNFQNITLPPNTNGYRAVYQRCCRTDDALNIIPNFDGISQGSTYEVQITPKTMQECNVATSAIPVLEFQTFPPTQLCANEEVLVDQSVSNGILGFVDSVQYSLCAPFEGGSGTNCIIPTPTVVGTCNSPDQQCDEPCPYSNVAYAPGYTFFTPMGPTSTVEIDRTTGQMIINPSGLGIYVVGICVTAYKDGQIWSTTRRDFQFKVFDCIADGATPPIATNGDPLNLNSVDIDTVEIESVYLVCNDLEVTFDQTSTQAISYFWDFGIPGIDSDTSIEATPTFTYPDTGTYVVTFVVNVGQPCVDTSYGAVKIFPQFNADFVFEAGCFTIPVEFTDSSISTLAENPIIDWQWDFGDGNTLNGVQNPSHQYNQAGTFTVTLTSISELGCSDTYSTQVTTLPSPQADFENLIACTDVGHQFNNTSSLNGTGLDSYVWDFGDGNGLTNSTTNVQPDEQTYLVAGDYNVTLAVNSTSGCSDTITKVLTVAESVNAAFNYSPSQVCPGQPLTFTNTTTEFFESFEWIIEGNSVTDVSPSFTYDTPGDKEVTLILLSNTFCGDTITQNVSIENGPIADFTVDSTCTNIDYTFENNSIDNGFTIDAFIWNFGDGNSGTGNSPTHQYTTTGDYTVELIVSSSLAICSDTTTKTISVKENIIPDFTYQPDTICANITPVLFTNTSTGSSWDSVSWNLGNDSIVLFDNPTVVYAEPGTYNVTLSLFDDVCGEFSTNKDVEALVVPEPNLPDTANICDGILFPLTVANDLGYDIVWSTGETSTGIQIDNSLDTIIVSVDNNGCIVLDTTFITRDCPAYLPNTFTPNGDGLNDEFLPLPLNITSFTLTIYDRWGDLIFETDSFDKPWKGIYSDGSAAPLDTYNYILEGIGLDDKVLFQHGIVNLIR